FPLHSQVFTGAAGCTSSTDPEGCGDTAKIQQFAAWTGQVARTFPTVHQFVVMNECNQPLFVNPQWDQSGQNQSAEICGRALAASYDELKRVSSRNFVWGVGLSPRGNDNPSAASNSSTSPVTFLRALGGWFRAFAAKTDSTGRFGYVGTETSANAAGGVIGLTATETYQASWYQQMLDLVACDPNVRVVNIYHLLDEAGLAGWQSGLYYVDRSAKASA